MFNLFKRNRSSWDRNGYFAGVLTTPDRTRRISTNWRSLMQYLIDASVLDPLLTVLDRLERRVQECPPMFRDTILKDVDAQQLLAAAARVRKAKDEYLLQTRQNG
jgi:hypothetical protein